MRQQVQLHIIYMKYGLINAVRLFLDDLKFTNNYWYGARAWAIVFVLTIVSKAQVVANNMLPNTLEIFYQKMYTTFFVVIVALVIKTLLWVFSRFVKYDPFKKMQWRTFVLRVNMVLLLMCMSLMIFFLL